MVDRLDGVVEDLLRLRREAIKDVERIDAMLAVSGFSPKKSNDPTAKPGRLAVLMEVLETVAANINIPQTALSYPTDEQAKRAAVLRAIAQQASYPPPASSVDQQGRQQVLDRVRAAEPKTVQDATLEVMKALPMMELTAEAINEYLKELDFGQTAADPVNGVRGNLSRLYRGGQIERVSRGRFRFNPLGAPPVDDAVADEEENLFPVDDDEAAPPQEAPMATS